MCDQKVINVWPLRELSIPLEAFAWGGDLRATGNVKPKLTAIFNADVAGYTVDSWVKLSCYRKDSSWLTPGYGSFDEAFQWRGN